MASKASSLVNGSSNLIGHRSGKCSIGRSALCSPCADVSPPPDEGGRARSPRSCLADGGEVTSIMVTNVGAERPDVPVPESSSSERGDDAQTESSSHSTSEGSEFDFAFACCVPIPAPVAALVGLGWWWWLTTVAVTVTEGTGALLFAPQFGPKGGGEGPHRSKSEVRSRLRSLYIPRTRTSRTSERTAGAARATIPRRKAAVYLDEVGQGSGTSAGLCG